MEDFIYKKKKVYKKQNDSRMRSVYYYVKNVGFELFNTINEAAERYGLASSTIHGSAIKSSKQTIDEFLKDKAVNKFIYADDPKAEELRKEYGLI